jgi:hypothetical protein
MHTLLAALQNTGFATAIREGESLFPWIESIHVLAIVLVVGTVMIVDLRLMGFKAHRRSVRALMREVLPLTWGAFAVAAASGFLLFASAAVKYAALWEFQAKMLLLAGAGLNMAIFHFLAWRGMSAWDEAATPPPAARLAGALSLCLWLGVLVMGRLIGFALQ